MRLILIRHGQTTWNAEGRVQGHTDVPLSALGRWQSERVAARLASEPISAIYSSDLQRSLHTAQLIAVPHNLTVQTDARLREISKGEWEGRDWQEVRALYPDVFAAWQANRDVVPHGAETLTQFAARLDTLLQAIKHRHADQTILLVGHGGSLTMLICLALGLEPQKRFNLIMHNTAVSELRDYPEGLALFCLNDTCHLTDPAPDSTGDARE
ncbi:MAG TPA: histidine phosphatase family protein [Aggregatilineaceae bacterium]|nr:histidine phosphatase family protein [Aggregatilineaceae bacterium]